MQLHSHRHRPDPMHIDGSMMRRVRVDAGGCPQHGQSLKRSTCRSCNAAYMRAYLRRRRAERPEKELFERAKKRAQRLNIPFRIRPDLITIPAHCPVLGIPLVQRGFRSPNSPSLDRIEPARGYVPDNIRVISDYANRLKGNRSAGQLLEFARSAAPHLREDYKRLALYAIHEAVLQDARVRSTAKHQHDRSQWALVAASLNALLSGSTEPI